MATLANMTIQNLGTEATEDDLRLFRAAVEKLMESSRYTEAEAIDAIYGDGDYLRNITALGL